MKDLTKVFIDLSKCTADQRNHIFSLLPEPENPMQYRLFWKFQYLHFSSDLNKWIVQSDTGNKTELLYPDFIKLFKGGEDYPGKRYQPLFDHLNQEHGLIIHASEMNEIIRIVHELSNKWINIESEADLPKETCTLHVYPNYLKRDIFFFYDDELSRDELMENHTHYQPITKPEPPKF